MRSPCGSISVTCAASTLRGLPPGGSRNTETAAGENTATAASPVAGSWGRRPCPATVSAVRRSGRRPSRQVPVQDVESGDARGEGAAGAGQDLRGRSLLDDPAAVEHDDGVGEQQGVERVVGDQDDAPVGEHPAQRLAQRRRDGDVERGHRLVEQEQPRLGCQRPGHRDPLGLAAGDLGGRAVGELRDADLRRASVVRLARASARDAPRAARAERDVVAHAQVREEQRVLGEQGDLAVVRRDPGPPAPSPATGERPPVERDLGPVGAQQPGDHGEHGRLAGAVGAEQRDGLARRRR